jgi:signal transduction histidine kinase
VAEDLALAFTLGQQVALDRRRHLTEAGLRASQDQLRALAIRLQDVREQERAAIAREIHDELGQELTALKLDIAWTRNRLRRSDPAESAGIDARLLDMSSLADRSIATVQRIASGLRPRVLDDLGLAAAVEWQAQQFQERTGIRCRLGAHIDDEQIPMPAATAAFRIFQEALTNVARHAEASRVKVQIGRVRGDLVLEVSDNGRGIRPEAVSSTTSIGLLGMRERAVALGGEVLVEGFPGRGSSVLLRLPLEPRQREES